MFEEIIQSTPFTGNLSDLMFRNINGMPYNSDESFTATVRALLWNRISNNDKLRIIRDRIRVFENDENVNCDITSAIQENALVILNIQYSSDADETNASRRFNSIAVPNGFHEFKDVQVFFKEKMDCRAFINEAYHCSVVLIRNMNLAKWHLIQCITPKLLPWFFNRTKLSVLEKNLLNSLRKHLSNDYKAAIAAFGELDEYISKKNAAAIMKFKNASLDKKKKSLESSISQYNDRIESMNRELIDYYNKVNEFNFTLNGILAAMKSGDTEDGLSDFISNNKDIHLIDCNEYGLELILTGYLDVYDPDAFETLAANYNSFYWDSHVSNSVFSDSHNRMKVLKAVFNEDPKFRIKTCGYYRLNIERGGVSVSSGFDYGTAYEDYYPNPHLQHHACLGNYQRAINTCLGKGDVVGAISQCISSVHSVNVTESPTFGYTCRELFTNEKKCFEDFEGNCYTAKEVLEILNSAEKANQENNQASVSAPEAEGNEEIVTDIPMADDRGLDAAYE